MKFHIALACILGSLTIGYTALADFASQPDSVENIAYINTQYNFRVSKRFLKSSGAIRQVKKVDTVPRKRGLTALV